MFYKIILCKEMKNTPWNSYLQRAMGDGDDMSCTIGYRIWRQFWVKSYSEFGSHLEFSTPQNLISDVVICLLNLSWLFADEKSQMVPPELKQNLI